MSLTGIDYFSSAMLIMSEVGDITRFTSPSKLVSWSGLCPTIHQSGNIVHEKNERWEQENNMDNDSSCKHSGG
jgi:transposase